MDILHDIKTRTTSLAKNLVEYKGKLNTAKEALWKDCRESTEKLEERMTLLNRMLKTIKEKCDDVNRKFDNKLLEIEAQIRNVNQMAKDDRSLAEIDSAEKSYKERSLFYHYPNFKETGLTMCGSLVEKRITLFNPIVTSTFHVPSKRGVYSVR